MKHTYAITGATGNVGNRVARLLLAQGHDVRVVSRKRERLESLVDLGASPFVGEMHDATLMTEFFRGADAALLVCKGDRTSRDYRSDFASAGRAYAAAARAARLKSAVFISSLGAHDDRNRGLVLMHGDVEQLLGKVEGLNVVHLRSPGYFENLLYFLPLLREHQRMMTPIAPDAPLDMAATADVAEIAAELLSGLRFQGKSVVEIHGQRDLRMSDIGEIIAGMLGQPFPAARFDRDADVERMVKAGIGRDFANLMNDTWAAMSLRSQRSGPPVESRRATSDIRSFLQDRIIPALQTTMPAAIASR